MRRPHMPPELAEHTVDRDTWQGMAAARVPSAYPVPWGRVPRQMGGLKGAVVVPELALPGGYVGATGYISSPSGATDYATMDRTVRTGDRLYGTPVWSDVYATDTNVYPAAGDGMLVVGFAFDGSTVTPPAGWTVVGTGTSALLTWTVWWAIHDAPGVGYIFTRDAPRPSIGDPRIFLQMILFRPTEAFPMTGPPAVAAEVLTPGGYTHDMPQANGWAKQMTWSAIAKAIGEVAIKNTWPSDPAGDYTLPIDGNDLTRFWVTYQYGAGHPLTGANTVTFETWDGYGTEYTAADWLNLIVGWPA